MGGMPTRGNPVTFSVLPILSPVPFFSWRDFTPSLAWTSSAQSSRLTQGPSPLDLSRSSALRNRLGQTAGRVYLACDLAWHMTPSALRNRLRQGVLPSTFVACTVQSPEAGRVGVLSDAQFEHIVS